MTRKFPLAAFFFTSVMGFLSVSTPVFAKDGMRAWMDRALRDIMHVHFYGAKEVDRRRKAYWEDIIPEDWDKKTTVKPVVPIRELRKFLSCENIQALSFRDWNIKRKLDKYGHPTMMSLAYWDAPAYLHTSPSRKYLLFDDWPIFVSMAVVGDVFEIEHILNASRNGIDSETLQKTHDLYEYRFREYKENYLYQRPIKILARKQCNGFRIFDFEVRENG